MLFRCFLPLSTLLLWIFSPLCGEQTLPSLNKEPTNKVLIMTIPKSGTNLLKRLLYLVTGINERTGTWHLLPKQHWTFEDRYDQGSFTRLANNYLEEKKFFLSHANYTTYIENYIEANPETRVITLRRDLRDLCVSCAVFIGREIDKNLGRKTSFDEKLMWVITNAFDEDELSLWNYKLQARTVLEWENKPNTYHFRFEDLVGEHGGGSNEVQRDSIQLFCKVLGVPLAEDELCYLTDYLWGIKKEAISTTFRKGEVGSWKKYFKQNHKESFKRRLGEELILLGYEEGYDW